MYNVTSKENYEEIKKNLTDRFEQFLNYFSSKKKGTHSQHSIYKKREKKKRQIQLAICFMILYRG